MVSFEVTVFRIFLFTDPNAGKSGVVLKFHFEIADKSFVTVVLLKSVSR